MTRRHKKQLNISLSPYLYREIEEIVKDKKEFSGFSDFCTVALSQFLATYKQKKSGSDAPTGMEREHVHEHILDNPLLAIA